MRQAPNISERAGHLGFARRVVVDKDIVILTERLAQKLQNRDSESPPRAERPDQRQFAGAVSEHDSELMTIFRVIRGPGPNPREALKSLPRVRATRRERVP